MPSILFSIICLICSLEVTASPFFIDFKVDPKAHNIELYLKDPNGKAYSQFQTLRKDLESRNKRLVFAMNAGMFMENLMPLGLYIENGKLIRKLNLRKNAYGNFYMQPNGVFFLSHKSAQISTTQQFNKNDVLFATQSGPMLIINNKLNPALNKLSKSRLIRNGVCLNKSMQVVFSISTKPVTFHEMAQYFKDELECENALYLDGAISQIYWPQKGRFGLKSEIGPMIGVTSI
jgi:uncharacterized protein YigE (DUF2233 family)